MAIKKLEHKEENNLENIKEELIDYINIQIKKNFNEEVVNANKRVIREKNKKIFSRNITIIFLLCVIATLLYVMYKNNYFDKYFSTCVSKEVAINNSTKEEVLSEEPIKEEPTLEELIDKYSYLLDNINISEDSTYIDDYYNGTLNNTLKNYLALNNLNFEELTIEEECNIIDEEKIQEAYKNIFNDTYVSSSFEYNGTKVKYIEKLKSYITSSIITKSKSNIKREIINIESKDSKVVITTIEGILKKDKLYNVTTSKEITSYKNDSLKKYESKLNKVVYTFDGTKLININ